MLASDGNFSQIEICTSYTPDCLKGAEPWMSNLRELAIIDDVFMQYFCIFNLPRA
ncbi:MAG: hypothetical protein NPMRth3_1150002 [Nitrosopumilales archaeon]|nr:MAG: hypothetical protein NPMRth3_1150002 [Nitrosopumilales archaeon]